MKKITFLLLIFISSIVIFISGCASTLPVDSGIEKKCAIVTVAYNENMYINVSKNKPKNSYDEINGVNLVGKNDAVTPFIDESTEYIRNAISMVPGISLIPAEEINIIPEYQMLKETFFSKVASGQSKLSAVDMAKRLVTTDDYVVADCSCNIEPMLYQKTGAELFAYVKVNISKDIFGISTLRTGRMHPQVILSLIFTDNTGKIVYNKSLLHKQRESVPIFFGKYNVEMFNSLCSKAIAGAIDKAVKSIESSN